MKRIACFLMMAGILIACKPKWQEKLERIDSKSFYGNNTENWQLIKTEEHGDLMHFFEKIDGDTTKKLILSEGAGGAVDVYEYEIQYPSGQGVDNLVMLGPDTLYFYHEQDHEKSFVVGEYAYRFRKMELDSAARRFYLEHSDSLRKLRGPVSIPR